MNDFDTLATFVAFAGLYIEAITDDLWGVEGIYSQQFSVGIFFFLLLCIIFFTIIVIMFMTAGSKISTGTAAPKQMRRGEKLMFLAIYIGIIAAVIMAVMQLLQGYLF